MELIDTHCHIDLDAFASDRRQVIQHARQLGVSTLVIPAVTAEKWQQLVMLCSEYPNLYFALGLHPYFIAHHRQQDLVELEELLGNVPAIAVGEIGLDYYDRNLDRQTQQFFFKAQIEIASRLGLPVIIHSRKSQDDIIAILKKSGFVEGGIMHAYNGSLQQATMLLEMGFKFGFGGMLTFERSTKLRKLAQSLPVEAIVLETDAPDMTVASHHGQRNSPEYLPEILHTLAEIRQEDERNMAKQTTLNAKTVLRL
jgi:TatD DNase family protein